MSTRTTLILLAAACVVQANAAITFFIQPEHCGHADGIVYTTVTGGVPPYTYSWSNGATTVDLNNVPAGSYALTVTDFLGAIQENTAVVPNQAFWDTYTGYEAIPKCDGSSSAWVFINSEGVYGPPPHSFTGACTEYTGGQPGYPYDFNYIWQIMAICSWGEPGSTYTTGYTDATGCPGSVEVYVPQTPQFNTVTVLAVEGSCSGLNNGSATIYSPPEPDYIYLANPKLFNPGWVENSVFSTTLASNWSYGSTYEIPNLAPGTYAFVRRLLFDTEYDWLGFDCGDTTYFTIEDIGVNCGIVTGRAFVDYNLNCTRQTNEPYVPGGIMEVQPGPYYATTDEQGLYSLVLPTGSYTVEQQSNVLGEHCTGGPIPFTITTGQTTIVHFPDTSSVTLDVQAVLSSGLARPGFEFQYGINVRNLTPAASGAISVSFTFDPTLTYLSATPNPGSVTGNTITWNQAQLTAWQQRNYSIRFQVPPDVGLLGYELEATASVSTANTDGNMANNTAINLRTITGAYDPNDKLAYTSSGSTEVWQINEDEWIDYTIRFQNTGTDTAFTVIITDTIPSNLDPGTIIIGAASHSFTWELRDQGTLKFFFLNIQLPDSNINEPLSHGFVGFRIRPSDPEELSPGDQLENIANIYFDYNPPVITEPSVLVAEFTTGIPFVHVAPSVFPNPTSDQLSIRWHTPVTGLYTWAIHSSDGRILAEGTRTSGEATFDTHDLVAGLYFLRVQHGSRTFTMPFTKTGQ